MEPVLFKCITIFKALIRTMKISLLGRSLIKPLVQMDKEMCAKIFTSALFVTAKTY